MRMLLRNLRTGKYLCSLRTWTSEMEAARDFRSISEALEAVRRHCLRNMELVLADVPRRIGEVPITEVTLEELLAAETEAL